MSEEHTIEVTSALQKMLKAGVPGTSPMTVASAHIGTSYETLRRRLKTGTLSLRDFESLCELLNLDPRFVYAHPDKARSEKK